jgi:hypothetical protein
MSDVMRATSRPVCSWSKDAQVAQELLPHPADEHDLRPSEHQGGQGHGEVGEGGPVERGPAAVLAEAVVDPVADEPGAGEGREREQHHDRQGADDERPVGPQHPQGAPDHPARLLAAEAVLLVQGDVAPPAHG